MALDIDSAIGAVKAHVRPVAHEIADRWTMYNIWGLGGTQDHLLGLALDFMVYSSDGNSIRTQVGNEIAAWFVKHSDRLNVSYVIWRQRIWNPSRDPAGASWDNWRRMEDRGDPTQNHMDHVHVSFLPSGVYTPPPADGPVTPTPGPTEDVIYVVKAGDTLSAIARDHNVTVAQLVGWNNITNVDIINIGQRLIVGKVSTVPTIKLSETGPGKSAANNRIVQQALRNEYGTVVVDGYWGPQTTSYYSRWQRSLGFTGSDADGLPGKTSLTALGKKYGFAVDATSGGTTTPPTPSTGEPAHNYTRTTYGGKTVNERTKVMLQAAARQFGGPFALTQGSYNRGVSASAGTHDGGGVVDISVNNMTAARRQEAVQCLRRAGFAAWLRTPSQGFAYHIHACAIGDREMASAAKNQVQSYFNGRDGLARNGADTNPPRPWPAWANKYNQ
jgi:LysM repeat protein